ncbi:MAG: DNA recombination/repair protein RecA, partial [Oscillospiraceae bacterium]|nr:DNA recombination/repair protein RecA [Oscillospiraceae bacterium]
EMGDSHVGLQARLMSQAMRKLTSAIGKTNTIVIFINQLREKIGVMYGNPETTTGGRALKYYASVRIDVRRVEAIKVGGEVIGNRTRAKVVKNKVAPPFKEAEFDIMFGQGISKMGEMVDIAVKLGIVNKSGAWFSYGDIRLGQGRDNAKEYFKANPALAKEIEDKVFAAVEEAKSKGVNALAPERKKAGKTVINTAAPAKEEEPAEKPVTKRRSANIDIDVE